MNSTPPSPATVASANPAAPAATPSATSNAGADAPIAWPEDFARPERLLDTAVLCARSGRMPPATLTDAARAEPKAIWRVPGDVLRSRVEELLLLPGSGTALQWLHEAQLLAQLLPELEATVDFSQEAGRRHKDVWEHTKQVVRQSVPTPELRWAALLHDIGKVPTRTFLPDGQVHFHGHAEVGARMFDDVVRRIPFDKPMRAKIRFLILHHLRANQYDGSWTDSAVRRFAREMGDHLQDLLNLSRADITSRRPGRRQSLLEQISQLAARIEQIACEDAKQPPLPTGLGNEIMARFGLPPSRLIGDLKRALEEAVERDEVEARREPEYYIEQLLRLGLLPKP
jgi:poly(A) polymerase